MIQLSQIKGFVFDLDGTIYLGELLLPGAKLLISTLRERECRTLFVTNKPLFSKDAYAKKLTQLGIETSPEEIITSGFVLGSYLAKVYRDLRYYVIGEDNLKNELRENNLIILDEFIEQDDKQVIYPESVDAVIVAFDRTLTYRKLNTAYQALINGARFFATNSDKTCPMPNGGIPDAGATIAFLEHLSGRSLELLAGKPSSLMMEIAIERMDLPAEKCILIGDRLETDIVMGQNAGMHTALVLTGATTFEQIDADAIKPDLILNNLEELISILGVMD